MNRFDAIFSGYLLISIVTYGHVWTTTNVALDAKLIVSLVSSILWPLYWSVEAWK